MDRLNHLRQEPQSGPGTHMLLTQGAAPSTPQARTGLPHLQLVVLGLAVAAAGAVVAFLLLRNGGGTPALPSPNGGPALVSQAQLERLAASTDHPVYWAVPKDGYSYELTVTSNGRIYVRYLPRGVKSGDPRPAFLVVGTYAQPGSYAYLRHAATEAHSVSLGIDNGGLALFNSTRPTSVYFTYPRAKYQVEVYDPSGDSARRLVLAGKITPLLK